MWNIIILKLCLCINGLIITILGLSCIFIGSVDLTTSKSKIFIGEAKSAKVALISFLILFGSFLTLFGIFGTYGTMFLNFKFYCKFRKGKRSFLIIFGIGTILFFCIFLTIGIISIFVFKHKWLPTLFSKTSCDKNQWLYDLNTYELSARKLFCTNECPCAMNEKNYDQWANFAYQEQFQNISSLVIERNGVTKIQDCKGLNLKNINGYKDGYTDALIELEKKLDCSGICQKIDIYMFSNINKGLPENEECLDRISSYFKSYSRKIGIISLIIALALLANSIFAFCLSCHPDIKKKEKQNYEYLLPSK